MFSRPQIHIHKLLLPSLNFMSEFNSLNRGTGRFLNLSGYKETFHLLIQHDHSLLQVVSMLSSTIHQSYCLNGVHVVLSGNGKLQNN